ncbi:hypothetical protein IRJ41_023206, partial [Triplophysa rosa]
PLFRQLEPTLDKEHPNKKKRKNKWTPDGDSLSTLVGLCLQSLAENMKDMWVKDYAQKYMDQYFFRYVMGPFSSLPGELLDELLCILSSRNLLTRAALHLLLLPQLTCLSLKSACSLVNGNLCSLIQIRCQNLQSLDLSGAQNVSSSVLCELLCGLHRLNSLSLAGTLCDQRVLSVVSRQFPMLKHLDMSTKALSSLLALDICLADSEGDAVAAVAFILLSLPKLHRLAIEGLGQACVLIQNREYEVTEEFTNREGVLSLKDLWARRIQEDLLKDSSFKSTDGEESLNLEEQIDEWLSLDEGQTDEVRQKDTETDGCIGVTEKDYVKDGGVTTCLRDVQGLTLDTLEAVGNVCPDLCVLSLDCLQRNADNEDSADSFKQAAVLARGLGRCSGQLRCLSLQFAGLMSDLVPALQAAGSHLLSLTLEGIIADGHTPLLELIHACPRLTSLTIHLDLPSTNWEGNDDDDEEEGEDEVLNNLPCIPNLRSLKLNFFMDEQRMMPALRWRSLKGVLWALIRGASLLQKLSLIAVPCRLDPVFKLVLNHLAKPLGALDSPPLHCLRSLGLNRSDITMETVVNLVNTCTRLSSLDLSGCWALTLSKITKLQSKSKRRRHTLQITWT